MTTQATTEPAQGRTTEQWTAMGIRERGGKRYACWLPPGADRPLWYQAKTARKYVIGALYPVEVSHDGKTTTMWGQPGTMIGRNPEVTGQQRQDWRAEEIIAEELLARQAAERKTKGDDPLLEAMAPLLRQASKARTPAARDALAAYVLRRLHQAWANPGAFADLIGGE